MALLARIREHRAFKIIARSLPPYLVESYGPREYYSPGQVNAALGNTGCNLDFLDHAYAMFCDPATLNSICSGDFASLREQVAESLFNGNADFSFNDFLAFKSSGGLFSGDDDVGLDSGGGGDGGD